MYICAKRSSIRFSKNEASCTQNRQFNIAVYTLRLSLITSFLLPILDPTKLRNAATASRCQAVSACFTGSGRLRSLEDLE
jgi:hypothetical protein